MSNSNKVENNDENRFKLAEQVMDSMDMKTMIQCMYEHLLEGYEKDDEYFQRDWKVMNE